MLTRIYHYYFSIHPRCAGYWVIRLKPHPRSCGFFLFYFSFANHVRPNSTPLKAFGEKGALDSVGAFLAWCQGEKARGDALISWSIFASHVPLIYHFCYYQEPLFGLVLPFCLSNFLCLFVSYYGSIWSTFVSDFFNGVRGHYVMHLVHWGNFSFLKGHLGIGHLDFESFFLSSYIPFLTSSFFFGF
jgi:hypothetical protein